MSFIKLSLGLAVVGGLLVSQLLTLYITPVYYVYIEHARRWVTRARSAPVRPAVPFPAVEQGVGAAHRSAEISR